MRNNFITNVVRFTKKNSPAILLLIGCVGAVGAAAVGCKQTLKLPEILDESKETIQAIHDTAETKAEIYSPKDVQKDLTIVYVQTGVRIIKLYLPAIGVGIASLGCILLSHKQMSSRNKALAAAYSGLQTAYVLTREKLDDYKNAVINVVGEDKANEIDDNVKAIQLKRKENNPVVVKQNPYVQCSNDVISPYARFFGEYTEDPRTGKTIKNVNWQNDPQHNIVFLLQVQDAVNRSLLYSLDGWITLNDVYAALGMSKTQLGYAIGWKRDVKNPNKINFGIHKDSLSYEDYINGHERELLLDFNVDGYIFEDNDITCRGSGNPLQDVYDFNKC